MILSVVHFISRLLNYRTCHEERRRCPADSISVPAPQLIHWCLEYKHFGSWKILNDCKHGSELSTSLPAAWLFFCQLAANWALRCKFYCQLTDNPSGSTSNKYSQPTAIAWITSTLPKMPFTLTVPQLSPADFSQFIHSQLTTNFTIAVLLLSI